MAAAKNFINTSELGRAIRRKRDEDRLGLRAVAKATGVSASTLSRIENGTCKPDAENIARLAAWLNIPMERVMGKQPVRAKEAQPVIYFPQETTPDIVEVHLRADRNLSQESAAALSELFRVAYKQFCSTHEQKREEER